MKTAKTRSLTIGKRVGGFVYHHDRHLRVICEIILCTRMASCVQSLVGQQEGQARR